MTSSLMEATRLRIVLTCIMAPLVVVLHVACDREVSDADESSSADPCP